MDSLFSDDNGKLTRNFLGLLDNRSRREVDFLWWDFRMNEWYYLEQVGPREARILLILSFDFVGREREMCR